MYFKNYFCSKLLNTYIIANGDFMLNEKASPKTQDKNT